MTEAVTARYTPAAVKAYQNNPLIEALPDYLEWSPRTVLEKLSKRPQTVEDPKTRTQKTAWLNNLPSDFFVATKRHYAVFETIDLLIRQGYVRRSPVSYAQRHRHQDDYNRLQSGEKITERTFEEHEHEQLTASLIGTSGMGKTRTVERILSFYPQLILHKRKRLGGPFLQIVFLHVECPHNGSVNALCRSLISEISALAGEDYRQQYHITDRTTLESLKNALTSLIEKHRVGLIVIDEIQNLASSKKDREDLFNFIVSLSNTLNVPLFFVGTPKIGNFLTNNMRTARRFGTRGFIDWKPLAKDCYEWRKIITELWNLSLLKGDAEGIPQDVEDKLFECSGGIIEILLKLFILTQNRILLVTTRKNDSTPERMTAQGIESVFNEFFQNMKPILAKMRNGDMNEILKMEDIAMPVSLDELTWEMRATIEEEEEGLDELAMREKDLQSTLNGMSNFSKDEMPPITQELVDAIKKGTVEEK